VASTDDVNSGYWSAGYPSWKTIKFLWCIIANIAQYDYIAYASPIDDRSAWGVSLIRFGVDDILNTTELIDRGNIDYNRISLFSTADYGFTFPMLEN
jgi:hypothetical protein